MNTDRLQEELLEIYSKIEIELILSVAERLQTYDSVKGTLEWYIRKLSELNVLNKDLVKILAKYSGKTEVAITDMLKAAQLANIDREYIDEAFKSGATNVNYFSLSKSNNFKRLLQSSVYDLHENLSLINTKAIQSARENYIKILNQAYVETMSGTYSFDAAVQKGIKKMAKEGITGATYESGRKIGIEPAVRRDTLSAVIQNVNQTSLIACQELGTNYVYVSQHMGARVSKSSKIANHAGWQGKVYQIEGSSAEYGNLVEETGYGTIEGLGGVNCRHRTFPYFPGISTDISPKIKESENEPVFNASKRLRQLERKFRDNKREWYAAKAIGDKEYKKKLEKKNEDILKQIREVEEQYPDLRSHGNRTLIEEDLR